MIRALDEDEMVGPELAHLVWLSTAANDEKLGRILREVLPGLLLIGVFEHRRLVAFVALDAGSEMIVIRYIAVDEKWQGRGHGRSLVSAAREMVPGRGLCAETDDDAVGFYRRIGFTVTEMARDPRWPERQRYACALA
ncbi:GNAT family N-acetyltransferase [Lolliginicoccus levis]|uniref:GNAT family N-acetyltransferase n=1 Tax=Lolliginicoccus levis TaxID=2919542 RepID=UPI00241CCD99|nr:GNAT family N-acetyltransferase [Lolliginicoccus levis]